MSQSDIAGVEDPLQQVCTEKDLVCIARQVEQWESLYAYLSITGPETTAIKKDHLGNYEQQKVEVLKLWKRKKGLQATFKVLADIFSKDLNDQGMVTSINSLAAEAFKEPSEDWVIEHIQEMEQLGIDNLQAAISSRTHMITGAYSETLALAANERKKLDVIVAALSHMVKQELMNFLDYFKSKIIPQIKHHEEEQPSSKLSPATTVVAKRDSTSVAVSPSGESSDVLQRTKLPDIDKKFRLTVKSIRGHLQQCDVQDLVTDFNISANNIPYFSAEVKENLLKCETIKDLFLRLSLYISWSKRDVLRVLVEVSDCTAAVDELDAFEESLDPNQSIMHYPLSQASSSICPDPNSDITMVAIKANKDLKAVTYREVEQYQTTIAERGGVSRKALDLQGKNYGSSILYWLIPKSMMKSFEMNIRDHLDFLYDQGIVEISLDPNIVITTGRKLRVRSLAYLTKLPPKDAVPPQRAEELQEIPTTRPELPERAEEILELAYQLKIDVRKREEEIVELDTEVKIRVNEVKIKEQECNQLKEQLDETVKQNEELRQFMEIAAQSSKEETFQEASHGIHSAQGTNLSFGVRGHTAVTCTGKVYIGGGVVSRNSGALDIIQVIDLSAKHVSHLPACPVKHFTLVSIDNQVVTVGGKTVLDNQVSDKLYCWNEAIQQWEAGLPPMPTPRFFHTTVVWKNYLIACGGRVDDEDTLTDSVEILNLQTKRWHTAASLPLKESGKHAVITESGKLYLLGGYLGNAEHYCELQKLVATTVTVPQPKEASSIWWRLEDTPSTDCAAALLRGSLVLIGGRKYETNKISSKILRYSNADKEWQHIGDLLFGRTACMAVALDYNSVLVIGGTVLHDQQPQWFSNSTEIITAN